MIVQEGRQLGLGQSAHFGGSKLTILEQHQGGNAAYAKLRGNVAVFVDVHFGDLNLLGMALGHFIQQGGDHLAGATPLGPEVNQNRLAGLENVGFKRGVGDVFDGFAAHGVSLMGALGGRAFDFDTKAAG